MHLCNNSTVYYDGSDQGMFLDFSCFEFDTPQSDGYFYFRKMIYFLFLILTIVSNYFFVVRDFDDCFKLFLFGSWSWWLFQVNF